MLGIKTFTGLAYIVVVFTTIVHSLGPITSATVVYRARQYFEGSTHFGNYEKLLYDEMTTVESGSIYPEALSHCINGTYKDIAEDTYKSGFINASVNYIRENYMPPWNNDAKKLIAFVLGVLSNQVSRSLWEGIGVDQSFLQTLANVNFHGSLKNASKAASLGADAVIRFKSNMGDYLLPNPDWYFPLDDLYNIYRELYGTVRISKDAIENCTTILALKEYLEFRLVPIIYPGVATISPFLIDQLQNYGQGGINNMACWTQMKWHDAMTLLENGTKSCTLPENPIFISCPGNHLSSSKPPKKKAVEETIKVQRSVTRRQSRTSEKSTYDSITLFYTHDTFSNIGWSMFAADLDGDGNEDMLIGAPGYSFKGNFQQGKVFILYSNEYGIRTDEYNIRQQLENVSSSSLSSFDGPYKSHAQFGFSVAVVDINLDGNLDVAVGAPAFGNDSLLNNYGIVYIYFGEAGQKPIQHIPNITITCNVSQCGLGFSMTVLDFNSDGNDDLVLGTPSYSKFGNQSGIVSGLPADSHYQDYTTVEFEKLIMQWSLENKQAYSWFGYSLRARYGVLMVSQPYFRRCGRSDCQMSPNDIQGVGSVSLYNFSHKQKFPNLTFSGIHEFEKAGYSTDIGFPYGNGTLILAVGMPGADVYGSLYGIPLHWHQAGSVVLYSVSSDEKLLPVANFDGDRAYSRFGILVKFGDINNDGFDDLVISASERSYDFFPRQQDAKEMFGVTHVYYGGQYFPTGNTTNSRHCEGITPCPGKLANLTTDGRDMGCRYGDQVVIAKAKKATSFASSVQFWNNILYINDASGIFVTTYNHSQTSNGHPTVSEKLKHSVDYGLSMGKD